MSFYDSTNFRPEVRARLDPFRTQLEAAAAKHGVPADLMFGTIAAESSGQARAVGDNGAAQGLWQVQTPFVTDWMGAGPDVRMDPVQSTERIMSAFKKNLDAAGGHWGAATVRYMRGPHAKEFDRIMAGEPPEQVLAKLPWVLARYRGMQAQQARADGADSAANPTRPKQTDNAAANAGVPALGISGPVVINHNYNDGFGVVHGPDQNWIRQGPRG
jgi:Transglycosylase SLT domain